MLEDSSVVYPSCTPVFRAPQVYGWAESGLPDYSFGDCGTAYARFFFCAMKIVCENVILNLFIGMILDNFGFIMEDVGLGIKEDDAWEKGSTADQVRLFCMCVFVCIYICLMYVSMYYGRMHAYTQAYI